MRRPIPGAVHNLCIEFGTKTVSRTCRKIWEGEFAGAAAINQPKREGLFFCHRRVMGIVARSPKKPDRAQNYQVNTKCGLPKKSWMVPGYSKTAQKIVAKAKGCPLRRKAIERGYGKKGSNVGISGVIDQKKGKPLFFFSTGTRVSGASIKTAIHSDI